MKTSIILHSDSLSVLDELSNEQSGILFKAIHTFMNGQEPELDFAMKMCFLPFRNQFIRDFEKYERKCEANRKNGLNGGRPRKTEKTDMVSDEPNQTESNRKNLDNKKDNKKENKNKKEEEEIYFEIFWNTYQKKMDKVKCFKVWKSIPEQERSQIQEQARKYVASTPDVKFRKNPLTWLNGQCWNDEITEQPKILVSNKYIPTL
jgi:hypothetical protein